MAARVVKYVMLVLMSLIGLLFASNICVLGNREAVIEMHEDLAPWADNIVVQGKVVNCFLVGILYLIAAYGIFRGRRQPALAGVAGSALFLAFYLAELLLWGGTHTRVWLDFSAFGGVCLLIGIFCCWHWRTPAERIGTEVRA